MTRFTISTALIAASAFVVVGLQISGAQANNTPDSYPWPDGPGKAIIKKSCLSCHSASVIVAKHGRTEDEWADVLSLMVGRGAVISDDDADTLVQYLATNFGPNSKIAPAVTSPSSGQPAAPENSGTASASAPESPVNVNKASATELASALGLTQSEAALIVQHREQFGNFKSWEDVASISGIPADKIKENQKRLTF